jgi:hypothetical protein
VSAVSVLEVHKITLIQISIGVEGFWRPGHESLIWHASPALFNRPISLREVLVQLRLKVLYLGPLMDHASDVAILSRWCHVAVAKDLPRFSGDGLGFGGIC